MSGFEFSKTSKMVLRNPEAVSVLILGFGLFGGFGAFTLWGNNLFERFGSLTVAAGVLAFGAVASELLNRAQDGHWAREQDDLNSLTGFSVIRRALGMQALVVFAGTIQWGFGGLLLGGEGCSSC